MRRECRWDTCTQVFVDDDSGYIDHLRGHVDAAQPESQGSTETESTQERQPGYLAEQTTTVEVKVTQAQEQGNVVVQGEQESASYLPR